MKRNTILKFAVIALVLSFLPVSAKAATVYLEASRGTISVGDTAIIAVKINSDGAVLNTVDGEVVLKSPALNLAVQEFSLANSAFGLWPRTPSLGKDLKTITFVGGVPGGFSIEGATLFKMVVEAKKEGTITISPQNMSVFLNDGKGTKAPTTLKDITINVVPAKAGVVAQNDWSGIVSADSVPPQDFIVVLGQDPNVFSGKKFAFFSSVDNQTGIDHYDVSEDGAPAVRSGSTYVLQNQGDNVKLSVVAYDKAGNKKSATYPASKAFFADVSWVSVIIIVILGIIVWMIFKKWKKRSTKNVSNNI